MNIAKSFLAGTAALAMISSGALPQEAKPGAQQDSQTGILTKIDRLHGTVTIQREEKQGGTVGANGGGAAEELKAQRGLSLEDVHAGDKVTYSASGGGDGRTITKIQKQKE